MAKTYNIVGLQQLAIAEIEQCGTAMTVFNILDAANADFSKLAGNVGWFQNYVTERLSAAFDDDFSIFATDNFFAHISNIDLYKFVVNCAVQLYRDKISRMLCTEQTDHRGEEKGEKQKRKEEEQDAAVAATTTSRDPSCADPTNNVSPHGDWESSTAVPSKNNKGKKEKVRTLGCLVQVEIR